MREIAHTRVRYGYRRVHVLLRRDGWKLGRKKLVTGSTARSSCSCAASDRSGARWSCRESHGSLPRSPGRPGRWTSWLINWSTVAAPCADGGRRVQPRSAGDRGRHAPARGTRRGHLDRLVAHDSTEVVFTDNGSEFTGRLLDLWAYHHQVRLDFSRPGKPTDNCFVETFNGSLRDECLNVHWFDRRWTRPTRSSRLGA